MLCISHLKVHFHCSIQHYSLLCNGQTVLNAVFFLFSAYTNAVQRYSPIYVMQCGVAVPTSDESDSVVQMKEK